MVLSPVCLDFGKVLEKAVYDIGASQVAQW